MSIITGKISERRVLRRGQAAIEYFVIFAAIIAFAVISAERLWPQVRDSLQGPTGFFGRAATRLVEADQ